MSDLPTTRFLLELKLDEKPPRAVMSAVTTGDPTLAVGDPSLSADVELGPKAPYELGMAFTADTPAGALRPQLTSLQAVPAARPLPFDPALVGDDGVLCLDWHLYDRRREPRDHRLDTQDSARLHITLRNRSTYFEAQELTLTIVVLKPDVDQPDARPDGNPLLSISSSSQGRHTITSQAPHAIELQDRHTITPQAPHTITPQAPHTIVPRGEASFDFLVVTRGPRAGLYTIAVEATYQLVYVHRELCRQTTAIAHLPLRIHGGSTDPLPGPLRSLPSTSEPLIERFSIPQRRLHMSGQVEQDGEYGHSKRRELHAIENKVILPGGGEVIVSYRLVKGAQNKPEEARCKLGYNPATKEIESYFSTSDEADMEITLTNRSELRLRHVYLKNVHLFDRKPDGSQGKAADQDTLPDGNFLFQVLPDNVYFGHLNPEQSCVRYLGLITRGVHSGRFLVTFEVEYEIVDGKAPIALALTVNPD
jgi:hypothetical protein